VARRYAPQVARGGHQKVIYLGPLEEAELILAKYDVRYVLYWGLERASMPVSEEKFATISGRSSSRGAGHLRSAELNPPACLNRNPVGQRSDPLQKPKRFL